MRKIRLTESQLNRVIMESVKRIIKEGKYENNKPYFQKFHYHGENLIPDGRYAKKGEYLSLGLEDYDNPYTYKGDDYDEPSYISNAEIADYMGNVPLLSDVISRRNQDVISKEDLYDYNFLKHNGYADEAESMWDEWDKQGRDKHSDRVLKNQMFVHNKRASNAPFDETEYFEQMKRDRGARADLLRFCGLSNDEYENLSMIDKEHILDNYTQQKVLANLGMTKQEFDALSPRERRLKWEEAEGNTMRNLANLHSYRRNSRRNRFPKFRNRQ